jgi:RimJ/RimL family protein N-acetyltransferase
VLIYGEDEYIAAWVADKLPHVDGFGKSTAIGIVSEDKLIAGCVYHDWRKKSNVIQMSIASISPMWARKENIHGLLEYPFEQLGCYKVFAATLLENEHALKVLAHIGFTREAILAHQFGKKQHAVINRMLRPDYDRLFGETNERQTISTPDDCRPGGTDGVDASHI